MNQSMTQERRDVPMAKYTTWRCGGMADRLYTPSSVEELRQYLASLDETVPVTWLGRGSNVLVREGGMRGVVIQLDDPISNITIDPPEVSAQGGTNCARLAVAVANAGLRGLEFLSGIPGSVGGALAMNAGAAGSEIWDQVSYIETLDRHGGMHRFNTGDIEVGYRTVGLPDGHGVLRGVFHVSRGEGTDAAWDHLRKLMKQRRETQPVSQASGGSVFRNPAGQYAAQLIEAAGLKGYRIGDAEVSKAHANFIINNGMATAHDIESLIGHVRDTVEAHSGVRLELEVRILGEQP